MVGNNAWVKFVTEKIERDYPNLTVYGYKLISPDTIDYNCIAWAAEDDETWWWPDIQHQYYWPPGIPKEETLEAFQEVYKMLGYEVCQGDVLEEGFQKIAIYTNYNKVPTRVARQLPTGKWTSKLGSLEDIEHNNLQGLTGNPGYGEVACILKKQLQWRKYLAQSNYQANLKSDRLTMTNWQERITQNPNICYVSETLRDRKACRKLIYSSA